MSRKPKYYVMTSNMDRGVLLVGKASSSEEAARIKEWYDRELGAGRKARSIRADNLESATKVMKGFIGRR